MDEHRVQENLVPLSLIDRIAAHVAATRRGEFRGKYEVRNQHGQRAPWQTHAWIAVTAHLFDLAHAAGPEAAGAALCTLRTLVEEVDARPEELVVFEDANAGDHF